MWPRFGVKIGNSTLCITYAKDDGKIEIVANKHGDRVSPAILLADGDEIEVGLTAKQKMSSKTLATAVNSFQLFSPKLNDEKIEKSIQCIPNNFNKSSFKFELKSQGEEFPTRNLSPYEVCVELFKATFELARQCHFSEDHPPVVLSIPIYYPYECWEYLSKAAEEAGFHVAQIIPEPTAAVLAYDLASDNTCKRVLCVKSGGLLTSFTLFEVEYGLYSIVAASEPFYIGGKQFTDAIVEFITKEFSRKYVDPSTSRRSMEKIRNAAENCKHSLTTLQTTQIYIDSLMDGLDFNVQMSRPRFESLIQQVLNKFMSTLNSTLETLNKDGRNIDEIVLSGGNMKIPAIQLAIKSRFPNGKLQASHPPDEVVATGCAKQSLYIKPEDKVLESSVDCPCILNDIFIWHDSDSKQLIFNKGTILPNETIVNVKESSKAEKLENGKINGTVFSVQMNDIIGKIGVSDIKAIDGVYRIKVRVEKNVDCKPQIMLIKS